MTAAYLVPVNLKTLMAETHPEHEGFLVTVSGPDGTFYWHERSDLTFAQAKRIAAGVRQRRCIDLNHWHARAPYGTEAWHATGEELRQIEDERYGFA